MTGTALVGIGLHSEEAIEYWIDDKPNLELSENEKVYLLNLAEVVDRISINDKK